jgi:hypothetical protein
MDWEHYNERAIQHFQFTLRITSPGPAFFIVFAPPVLLAGSHLEGGLPLPSERARARAQIWQ